MDSPQKSGFAPFAGDFEVAIGPDAHPSSGETLNNRPSQVSPF
jgi:hypothetical protein